MSKYNEVYGSMGAIELYASDDDASEKDIDFANQIREVLDKAEKFDECLELLEELKYTANPHDVMSVYDNVISVFRRHLEE